MKESGAMSYLNNFPTYKGDRPLKRGVYVNEEKEQVEDWTHRSLKAEDPDPIAITFEALGSSPEIALENWLRGLTASGGGGREIT